MEDARTIHQDELPALVRQVRLDAGLTQQDVAGRLGVTNASVSRAERINGNRWLDLQRRILEEIGGLELHGPLWEITEFRDKP